MQTQLGNLVSNVNQVQLAVDAIPKTSSSGGGTPPPPPPPPPPHPSNPLMIDSSFPLPKYDPHSMTPEHFITEVEEFLTIKGVNSSSWHILVGRMMPADSEILQWYRANKSTLTSWNLFKSAFRSYESNDFNVDLLHEKLFARKQKIDEAFESYAWDMHRLYLRVKPSATQSEIVERVLNSCLSEIAAELIPLKCVCVTDLVKQARVVINNLNKIRKFEGKQTLRIRKTDQVVPSRKSFQNSNRNSSYKSPSESSRNEKVENNNQSVSVSSEKSVESPSSSKDSTVFCKYCKNSGHEISSCLKLKQRERSRQTNRSENSTGGS
jgi:hypothetical protein